MASNLALQILIQAKDAASAVIAKVKDTITGASAETNTLGRAASALTGTFGLVSTALASIGFGAFLKKTIDAADALDELSQKTGVSVRALAGLQRLPDLAEVPIENVGKAINKLSAYMANNAEAALQMGLSAKDPVEALYQFSDVFAATESAQERAALGVKVLGKSYADLAPILLQGGEALRSQVDAFAEQSGITEDAAARAGELNDKMTNLGNAVRDFATRAVLPAIAPLSELVKYFGELFFASDKASQSMQAGAGVYGFVAKAVAGVGLAVDIAGRGIGALLAKFEALATFDFKSLNQIDKAFGEDNAKALERYKKLLDDINAPPKTSEATKSAPAQITTEVDVALKKFEEWGATSKTVTDGIGAGLQKLSEVELKELKATLVDAFESGKNSSKELQDALAQIKTEELSRAWKTLGQESQQSLKKTADEAKTAYIAIRDSGTASATDLQKAWEAVSAKIMAVNEAANAASEADKQRQQNLRELDQIGATPQEAAYQRHKDLTEETIAFDKAMRQGDYAEAARVAQEKEKLAFEAAKADTEAAQAGEIASYNAYDAKQRYKRAIEDTKKALEALKQAEQESTGQPQNTDGNQDQPAAEKAKTPLEQQTEAAIKLEETVKRINETPVRLGIETNFKEVTQEAREFLDTITKINSLLGNKESNGDSLTQQLSDEALKRGAPA